MGASLLQAAGRPEWAASDATDFVTKAAALAADVQTLADIRAGQRASLL